MKDRPASTIFARGVRLVGAGHLVASSPRARVVVPFDEASGLHAATWSPALFSADEPVTVTGAGSADVPPFVVSASAPSPVSLDGPRDGTVVDREGGLVLTWPPGGDGYVDVLVKTGGHSWPCVFLRARGTATIAARLFDGGERAGWHVSLTTASARTEARLFLR